MLENVAGRHICAEGLVCGYKVDASGEMKEINWIDIDQAMAADDSLVWLHFDQANAVARNWIAACDRIPASAKTILLGSNAHMRIETAESGLAGVVGDLHHEFTQKSDQLDVTSIFLPMTLINGKFGMNLGGLPGQQSELGFWFGIGLMVLTAAATLFLLRHGKMLAMAGQGKPRSAERT